MTMPETVESLTEQLKELALLVKKQNEVISKTGEQVLTLQVENTKTRVGHFGSKPSAKRSPSIDTSDFATNEDLVQLVGELQGQLDVLEERSIRRLINSKKTGNELLAPLLNQDGEEPPVELFPGTLAEFKDLSDEDLVKLARFYELLPPTAAERAKFEEFVETENAAEVETVEVKPSDFSSEDLIDAYDKLSRFLGLTFRRGEDAW